MIHQHPDPEPDGVSVLCADPGPDLFKKLHPVFPEHFRPHLVAGRPVVNIRQKPVHFRGAPLIILHFRNDKRMQLILLKVRMRKIIEKHRYVLPLSQFLRIFAKCRRPHSDHGHAVLRRDETCLKIPVLFILQCVQSLSDLLFQSVHDPLLLLDARAQNCFYIVS